MRPWITLPLFTLLLPSLGCLSAVHDDEPMLEQERMELPPQPLPLEGSAAAFGMLRVVNELGMSALDEDVGLDQRAAQSILSFRAGDDHYVDTSDDRYVDSLAQLEQLYWLGEANLWTIQQHALREGFVAEELTEATCAPVLVEAIDDCLRFVEQAAGTAVSMDDRVPSCLVKSEPICPSSEFFAHTGVIGHEDPMLGYHALLCESAEAPELCELGVAGIAMHLGPHCDARFDPSGQ